MTAARAAFRAGDDRAALTALRRERDAYAPRSVEWATLERLVGLVLIHMQREVEGTFALERSDALLDAAGAPKPTLDDWETL